MTLLQLAGRAALLILRFLFGAYVLIPIALLMLLFWDLPLMIADRATELRRKLR